MMTVDRLTPEEWKQYSEQAHLICFGRHKPVGHERIDFALVVRRDEQLVGYVTCKELDGESLYWQFGGAFPGSKQSVLAVQGYQAFLDYCKKHYKRVAFLVENDNKPMLKLALAHDFKIVGLRTFRDKILLEHGKEFE